MGRDFFETYAPAKAAFKEADEALGYALSNVIFEGPEDELTKTAVTQPAILVTSIAIYRSFIEETGRTLAPAFFAGHSLGEYTALVAAGALELGDAVRLVAKRGALMQQAVPVGHGAMAAIIGLDFEAVSAICRDSEQGGVVSPANVNAPTQIVISGDKGAVERASALAKERGAGKVIPLKVSAPFHCSLMRSVADKLQEEFRKVSWNAPSSPIAANVDATFISSAAGVRDALYRQTYSPVLWTNGVDAMVSAGVDTFVEFGPGNVLSGLVRRTSKTAKTASVSKTSDIAKAIEAIDGAGR